MSCDGNRGKFFGHAAQHKAVQDTFGSPAEAEAALEQIFNTARSGAVPKDSLQQKKAEARTKKLFDEMRQGGLKPPTHSANGLPRKDAQFGYAAVQQTLDAVRAGKPLPALARSILDQKKRTRQVSAVKEDAKGYFRCANCGRFASRVRAHVCPATANSETLAAHLRRRLGIEEGAYGAGLGALLAEARQNGTVSMRHGLTGERVEVTLDGLPLALTTGFAPTAWKGISQVELTDGRIVGVLDPSGLNAVQPTGNSIVDAAAAYGLSVAPGTVAGSATKIPPVSYHSVQAGASTEVSGGQEYDLGHFIGTEYRKRDAKGAEIEVNGIPYKVGSRSQTRDDWSSARISGLEPPPKGGVAVGRTLVEAVGILSQGEITETTDGQVQVYDAERRELLAVFDPATNTVGDTAGTPNASSAQMAAVLAYRALHPQNGFDAALGTDLLRARNRTGTPLAAADSGYIALKSALASGDSNLLMGGTVASQKCPKCGRFMGDAHICPAQQSGTGPAVSSNSQGNDAGTVSTFSPQVDVQVDTTPIAEAIRAGEPTQVDVNSQVTMDADTFAQAIQQGLSNINISMPEAQAAVSAQDFTELRESMTKMTQAVESLARSEGRGGGDVHIPDRLVEVTESLAAAVSSSGVSAPISHSSTLAGRCPKCGQFAGEDHTCPERQPRQGRPVTDAKNMTAQEHILSSVTLAAPDPYLMNVPQSVGGQTFQALEEFIPTLDPNFEINEQTEKILRTMSATLQLGAGKEKSAWTRAFGLFGPAGTGKNTIARQLAASLKTVDADGEVSQGMSYTEANITPESSMQELIGTTVLETDPVTGSTVSRTKLGKIGLAAAMGSVISVNEIVRNPKLATALQSMIEDGEIQIDSPEQGMIRIPVHPSTVFIMTWNPGYEGDSERPGQAPLSRIIPMRLDRPSAAEQSRRVESFFADVRGEKSAVDSISARRKEIVNQNYSVPADITPTREEIDASVRFFNEVATLSGGGIGERQIGLNSDTPTSPGQRQLNRFIALGKTIGWNDALVTLKVVCDQDDQFESQWALIRDRFEVHFGLDGETFSRPAPEQS